MSNDIVLPKGQTLRSQLSGKFLITMLGEIMKSKLIASLFVTSALFTSVPAFASGYGPAPSYMPSVGAPSSQRGPSVLTIAAQRNETRDAAYGGTENENAQSGSTVQKDKRTTAFTYH